MKKIVKSKKITKKPAAKKAVVKKAVAKKVYKPTTLVELFNSPEKWIKHRSQQGGAFCLTGAVDHVYGSAKYVDICNKLRAVVSCYSLGALTSPVAFNDSVGTKFIDIQRVVRLAEV